jgi:ABC-type lipoprotein release transport system permease subunit
VVLSLGLARVAASIIPGIDRIDPATVTAAVAVLLLSAAAASDLPARRASRIDPIRALRID